jgi:tRNA A-37 threonylcarbamoyl transferase component Bud32
MSETREHSHSLPPAPSFVQIDSACDRFEAEWKSGREAKIEDYLDGWEEPERSKLLYELMSLEIGYRKQRGEHPSQDEHASRFSDSQRVVQEVYRRQVSSDETIVRQDTQETLMMRSELTGLQYHAEGGLGIVYAAEDRQLKRNMAIKFIHDRVADDPDSRARFQLEAEVTSRLEHPGVVPVHGLGRTDDGRLFYAMRFIDGETLDVAIDRYHDGPNSDTSRADRPLQYRELLLRFVAVCQTIAYAHNRGIIHRDIKPVNIMLGRYGQTIVVDWGLALPVGRRGVFKESGERTLMPSSGSESNRVAAGTPAFMSPEQASGSLDLTPASDIYALGVTLYKILCGSLPFGGQDCLSNVQRGVFPRPTQVNRHASKALEAVCLKAMSLLPQDRYPTALELAKDVENYLADVPVSAYREPLGRRLARWARRHRTWAQALCGALLVVTFLGILASAWLGRQAHREGDLHAAAEAARQSEYELRKQGLQVSAQFAARMLANQIDIRWRILEKEAADRRMHQFLEAVNADPLDESAWQPLQEWLDARGQDRYPEIACRSWFVQSFDGRQVARSPSHEPSGARFSSLGTNYAYRDYFHGGGRDYYQDQGFARRPLREIHNSTAMESTNEGDLIVVFSAPIQKDGSTEPIGVLAMSIELGSFADLQVHLPAGQKVLLVETRKYYLLRQYPTEHEERGEGLVLHHEDFGDLKQEGSLPHVSDEVVRFLQGSADLVQKSTTTDPPDNLLPDDYRDPVARDRNGQWLAAAAPVLVSARGDQRGQTGWHVIVQQRQLRQD